MPADNFSPEDFASRFDVSRETIERLKIYAAMLAEWNARTNLVSQASLKQVWRRHFLDSAQLAPFIPESANCMVDLGSGAGFPGLVLAEMLRNRKTFRVVLYEATGKKCKFLEAISRKLGLEVEIRNMRIEDSPPEPFDIIVARALAPLERLLPYAQRFWGPNSMALFLKGQNVGGELTQGAKSWNMKAQRHPSQSDPSGAILRITELHRAA